jgi:glycosyltransferase involved in cell wall biosynthesis
MKIALLVGRNFEGAGVTMYVRQLSEFLKKNSIEHSVFALDDKKWGRANMQEKPEHTLVTQKTLPTLADTLNLFDFVFINSVPSVKHSQWAQDGFLSLVKQITSKKIIFQNDHKIASIHRNANFFELCNLCDGIVSHSITSPFYNKLVEIFGADIKKKFIQLHVGFNFEQLTKYRKEDHVKKITYLGRYATFKQPDRLFGFLPYAKQNNLLLEMKGVERSLGALNIFYDNIEKKIPKHDIIEVNKKTIENGLKVANNERDFEHIYIFGPYDYVDGMQTLSKSLVGCDFYHLDKMAYGNNTEYAQN